MSLDVVILSPVLGAEVRGIDGSKPLNDEEISTLRDTYRRHHLVLLRDQHLTRDDFERLVGYFWPVKRNDDGTPWWTAVSNVDRPTLNFYAQRDADNRGLSSTKMNHDIESFDQIQVPCTRLDDFFRQIPQGVGLIKIDTQGSELDVLLSAREVISKSRPIILLEFEEEYFASRADSDAAKREIESFFEALRYRLYCVTAGIGFLPAIHFGDYFHGDIIAVPRRDDAAMHRAAPPPGA